MTAERSRSNPRKRIRTVFPWVASSVNLGQSPGLRRLRLAVSMSLPADPAVGLRSQRARVRLTPETPWSRMHLVKQGACLALEASSILVGTAMHRRSTVVRAGAL